MDTYHSKQVSGGVQFSRSGSHIAFRGKGEDRSIQYCNHLECSARPNTRVGSPQKLKSLRPAFFSTGRKETVGSSSRAVSTLSDKKKSQQERQNRSFLQERGTLRSSSIEEKIEDFESNLRQNNMVNLEVDPTSAGIQMVLHEPEVIQPSIFEEFSLNINEALGNGQVTSNSRTRRPRYPASGSGSQDVSSSSIRYPVVPRNVAHTFRPKNQVPSTHRYGLRNLSCTSISDVLPSGCSSDVGHSKRIDASRKIYSDGGSSSRTKGTVRSLAGRNRDAGEGSSARSKGTIRPLTGGSPESPRSSPSGTGPPMLEHPIPESMSRRTINRLTSRDGVVLVRDQRGANGDSRTRLFEHINDDTFLLPEAVVFPTSSRSQFSLNEAASATSSQSFSTSLASIPQAPSGRSGSITRSARTRRRADSEDNNIRGFCGPWMHRDGYQRFNMEGIAEILLALERIEQDEVLTYEELMVLESNLFSSGTSFHDRHRDMRMDIDNMSYEELLALEEKMGTVSTALTEEALSRCLKRSIYTPMLRSGISRVDDDAKCSICQEEYNVGDEVGKLHCDHHYHVACIHQWFQQKNWCPICKTAACRS